MGASTRGYAEQADALVERYEAIGFEHKHEAWLDLLPAAPARALDIGAATGADASWLAAHGHPVLAVEPVEAFRAHGRRLHPSPGIEWLADELPALATLRATRRRFDAILVTAVWMHLDADERREAMPTLAALAAPGGRLFVTLRHGPVPEGRRMFEVSAAETVAQAAACGFGLLRHCRGPSRQAQNREAGIEWTRLAFQRATDRS